MEPILVAAAMGFELKPLTRRLGKVTHINREGLTARQAWLKGQRIVLFRTGLGRKKAVEAMRAAMQTFEPKSVLFVGLAGALRAEFKLTDPFVVGSAALWASDSENLSIDRAVGLNITYENNEMPLIRRIKGGRPVRRARLLTVDAFVNTVREKRRLGTAGYDIVDMEFGAIATEINWKNVPLAGLMTISDTLLHDFPAFKPTGEGMKGTPPPRLMANSYRACKVLGSFAHLWLKMQINTERNGAPAEV